MVQTKARFGKKKIAVMFMKHLDECDQIWHPLESPVDELKTPTLTEKQKRVATVFSTDASQ